MIEDAPERLLRRAQAAKYVVDTYNVPCSPKTLAKLACVTDAHIQRDHPRSLGGERGHPHPSNRDGAEFLARCPQRRPVTSAPLY